MMSVLNEIRKQTLTMMTAALGFVAAFLWRDAIQAWLAPFYEGASGPMNQTLAALGVTVIVVVITLILTKLLAPKESKGG
jgi:divalent metal cation (Fe/Co/Zn/Cd) transporter